jgi:3-hydroxybutyrate dehydrogenase
MDLQNPVSLHPDGRRIAVVIGGTGDVGSGIVDRLAHDGWQVHFSYRTQPDTAKKIEQETKAKAFFLDLNASELPQFPPLVHALVNCVGSVFEEVVNTNLVQAFRVVRHALPSLIEAHGTIVNISSIWGFRAVEGVIAYVSAKHGMRGLTAGLARDCGPLGVTCNEICPGAMRSTMLHECMVRAVGADRQVIEDSIQQIVASTPTRRLATPADIAASVAFLCSSEARSINGASLVVDGGFTA